MKRRFLVRKKGIPGALGEFEVALDEAIDHLEFNEGVFFEEKEPTAKSLSDYKGLHKGRVNTEAGMVRIKYISTGHGIEVVYMLKGVQAEKYLREGGADIDFPLVQSEAQVKGITLQQAALGIAAQSTQWTAKAAEIEVIRRTAEIAIKNAVTKEEVDVASDNAMIELAMVE